MKLIYSLLIFTSIINSSFSQESKVTFRGSKIEIPDGFTVLSEEELRIFRASSFDRSTMLVFDKNTSSFDKERIIIFYDSLPGTRNIKFDKLVKIKLGLIKDESIVLKEVKIDSLNHFVFGKKVDAVDTSMFGFSIDKFGVMSFQLNKSAGLDRSSVKEFENILKSINHKDPFIFTPRENPEANKAKKDMEISGWFMTLGFLAMALVWLVRKYAINKE